MLLNEELSFVFGMKLKHVLFTAGAKDAMARQDARTSKNKQTVF
jgi:hypothetical protein